MDKKLEDYTELELGKMGDESFNEQWKEYKTRTGYVEYSVEETNKMSEEEFSVVLDNHFQSPFYKRDKGLAREKIRANMRMSINRELEKQINNESDSVLENFSKVKITRGALNKANYIAKRTSELANSNLEIYMYLLNDVEKQNQDDLVCRDIYIGKKQVVEQGTCDISDEGSFESLGDIENSGKKIFGWCHSHGIHQTFHSSKDNINIKSFADMYGIKKDIFVDFGENKFKFSVNYSPSMVVNSANQLPYCAVGMTYSSFGDVNSDDRVYKNHINQRVDLEIVNEDEELVIDTDRIDEEIINEVLINSGVKVSNVKTSDVESTNNLENKIKDKVISREWLS